MSESLLNTYLLLVEDDPDQAALLELRLQDAGYRVLLARNGAEAQQCLQQAQVDLVLADYRLPDMTGVDLLRQIGGLAQELATVIMTATSDLSLAYEALEAGVDDFVSKDPQGQYMHVLPSLLKRALEKHALRYRAHSLKREVDEARALSLETLNAIDEGVLILSQEGELRFRNHFFDRLFEVSYLEQVSLSDITSLCVLLHERASAARLDSVKGFLEALQTRVLGEGNTLDLTLQSGRVLELRSKSLAEHGLILVFQDVTLQRREMGVLAKTIQHAPVGMLAVSESGEVVLANEVLHKLCGYPAGELLGMSLDVLIPERFRQGHRELLGRFLEQAEGRIMGVGRDLFIQSRDGREIPVELSLSTIDLPGRTQVLATVIDISPRIEAEAAMRRAGELTQAIIDNSPVSMMAVDGNGKVLAVSPAMETLTGYSREHFVRVDALCALLAEEAGGLIVAEEQSVGYGSLSWDELLGQLTSKNSRNWLLKNQKGTELSVHIMISRLKNTDASDQGYLLMVHDRSAQKQHEKLMEHIAYHDSMTQLPNRSLMLDRLGMALQRQRRAGGRVGVIVLDVDHFKTINDTLGHDAGDELLIELATRLKQAVRGSDTVARMGGDEFVLILPDIGNDGDAEAACQKIHSALSAPFVLGGETRVITTSFGLAIAPDDAGSVESLLKAADTALYEVKRRGRNGFGRYSGAGAEGKGEDLSLIDAAVRALKEGDFTLFYQPIFDLASGRIVAAESYLRWQDDRFGELMPDRLLPILESRSIMADLMRWTIPKACIQMADFCQGLPRPVAVCVNISKLELTDATESVVQCALHDSNLAPENLILEIAGWLFDVADGRMLNRLASLSHLGVRISVNVPRGFQWPLQNLVGWPINEFKLDAREFGDSQEDARYLGALSVLCRSLNIRIVVKAVETRQQAEFFLSQGITHAQGFYLGPVYPGSELQERFLAG